MSSYTTRSLWRWSVLELRTGRKVRNCRFLTICVHVSLSTYLSITRPSCNISDRFDLIFGFLVGRWHPHSMILNIWHCCEQFSRKVKNHGQKGPKLLDRFCSALSSPGRVVYWNVAFFLGALPYVQLYNKIIVAMVSSWASNGQKGEKLSLFDHLCPRVTFNVPLYNKTQLQY